MSASGPLLDRLSTTLVDRACGSLGDNGIITVAIDLVACCAGSEDKDEQTPAALQQLFLHANSCSSRGAEMLAAAVFLSGSGMRNLSRLALHENRIGNKGAALLFAAMRRGALPCLVSLNLSSNLIGDKGAEALGNLLDSSMPLSSLKEISLAANRVQYFGIVQLVQHADAALRDLKCPVLMQIDVRANHIDCNAAKGKLIEFPGGAQLVAATLREQLLPEESPDEEDEVAATTALDATLLELQPLVAHRMVELKSLRAAAVAKRAEREAAANRAVVELARREVAAAVAVAVPAAVHAAMQADAEALRLAESQQRTKRQQQARHTEAEYAEANAQQEQEEAKRRDAVLDARVARRRAEEARKRDAATAAEAARQTASKLRKASEVTAQKESEELAKKASERRKNREGKVRSLREMAAAQKVARGFEAQAHVAQVVARKLDVIKIRSEASAAALIARQESVAEHRRTADAGRQQGTGAPSDEIRRQGAPRTTWPPPIESCQRSAMSAKRLAVAKATAGTAAAAAAAAAASIASATPTSPAAVIAAAEAAAAATRVTEEKARVERFVLARKAATAAAASAIADVGSAAPSCGRGRSVVPFRLTSLPKVQSAPLSRPQSAPLLPAHQRHTTGATAVATAGATAAATAAVTAVVAAAAISATAVQVLGPTVSIAPSTPTATPTATPTTTPIFSATASSRNVTMVVHLRNPLGNAYGTSGQCGQPGEATSRKNARSHRARPLSARTLAHGSGFLTKCFLMQESKGHGVDRLRDALLRRGWREMPKGNDPQHVLRCLRAAPPGLSRAPCCDVGFVWLRGDRKCR